MGRPRRHRKMTVEQAPVMTVADHFKAKLGWKRSLLPFHTTANRECGSCHDIKPGSEFDIPVSPGRPDLNLCTNCTHEGHHDIRK